MGAGGPGCARSAVAGVMGGAARRSVGLHTECHLCHGGENRGISHMTSKIGTRIDIPDQQFTSGEAEVATRVPQVTQRDWLRRGLIHPGRVGGRTAFRSIDLAELVILRELTSHGMFVAAAAEIAPFAAAAVMTFAERASTPADLVGFVGMRGDGVRRFLIVPNGGEACRCDDPCAWFALQDAEGKPASALVLDCRALGEEMARRLPRPLLQIKRSEPE